MICSRCLTRRTISRFQSRSFASTPSFSSTPLSPSPAALESSSRPPGKHGESLPTSSIPAGTILRGLNFLKGRDDPVALEDDEYPEWLWRCLDEKKAVNGNGAVGGDEFSKSKKLRRQAAKARRKAAERALLSGDTSMFETQIPIQQQSIDLSMNGQEAFEQRADLKKAMRKERRANIKEGNYLKGM